MKTIPFLSAVLLVATSVFFFACKTEDPKAEALRTLTEADRLWCQAASTDLDEFISFLDKDVVWLFCNFPKLYGKDAVRDFFIQAYAETPFTLTWTPEKIEVSNSGDLGYAYGTYSLFFPDSPEQQPKINLDYATVWQKQSDNSWKVVLEADY